MHFFLEKSIFTKILSHCQNVIEKKSTLPILGYVLLKTKEGELSVCATDMDVALVASVPADVKVEGVACVSAQLLYDIVKKLNEKVLIEVEFMPSNARLIVVSGRSRFEIGCLPAQDFPELAQTELTHEFSLPAPVLKHLFIATRDFIASEDVRYNLSGIYLHYHEENGQFLRAVSSDMHRLACVQCPAPTGALNMPSALIGRKTINEALKLIEETDSVVDIGLSSTRIEFRVSSPKYVAKLTARQVDALFPQYTEALFVPEDKKMICLTRDLESCVDRIGSVVSTDKVSAIKIYAASNTATFTALSHDKGSGTEDLDIAYFHENPVQVCCNPRYLLEVIQQIKTDEVELLLQDEDSSILIQPVNDPNMVYILMPMEV